MCVKDEADLLPQVYPHVRNLVDYLYVYEDGSTDGTWDIVKDADYAIRKVDDTRPLMARPNYYHLLEKIKKDFKGEEVWCFITMGDRFFLNKTPQEMIQDIGSYDAIEGVQLDFLRHRADPWTIENDPWPDYSNIRKICHWAEIDERCIVAFKLADNLTYEDAIYPWPGGYKFVKFAKAIYSVDMPFLEHQGRRSPKGFIHRYTSGSRIVSKKYIWDFSSFEKAIRSKEDWFAPYKVMPWIDNSTLDYLVWMANCELYGQHNINNHSYFFWGLETAYKMLGLPERKDI